MLCATCLSHAHSDLLLFACLYKHKWNGNVVGVMLLVVGGRNVPDGWRLRFLKWLLACVFPPPQEKILSLATIYDEKNSSALEAGYHHLHDNSAKAQHYHPYPT